jgi:hypothetical protein
MVVIIENSRSCNIFSERRCIRATANPFLAGRYLVKLTRRRGALALAAVLLLSACGAGGGNGNQATPSSPPASHSAGTPTSLGSQDFPAPDRQNIKVADDGKSFKTVPNFTYLGAACGRPCNPAIFHDLNAKSGEEQLNLDGWPLEAGPGPNAPGHELTVVCQKADGPSVRNSAGATSRVWDVVSVPAMWLTPKIRAKYSPNGEAVQGWTPDIWLQNAGKIITAPAQPC